jgi:hypothetical protein
VKDGALWFEAHGRANRGAFVDAMLVKDHRRPAAEAALKILADQGVIRGPLDKTERRKGARAAAPPRAGPVTDRNSLTVVVHQGGPGRRARAAQETLRAGLFLEWRLRETASPCATEAREGSAGNATRDDVSPSDAAGEPRLPRHLGSSKRGKW